MEHTFGAVLGRPALIPLVVLAGLLAGAILAPPAVAIVPNPDESLISRWEPCEPETGVTVIVDFQDLGAHDVQVGCAEGEQASGLSALHGAGFELVGTAQFGLGFVCRINGLPSTAEQSCNATPPTSAYWSYWHGKPGGQWQYSGTGASSYKPKLGSVEGWSFSRRLDPGGPAFRISPQDGSGAALNLPEPNPSSSAQLRPAQAWIARRLEALAPADTSPTFTTALFEQILAYATALSRSGYELDAPRFAGVRDMLANAAYATAFTTFDSNVAWPRPERLGPYAIALGALQGSEPTLSDGSSLRARLIATIDPATGGVKRNKGVQQVAFYAAPVLEGLALTGSVPAEATPLVERIKALQKPDGSFEVATTNNLGTMLGLAAARDDGVANLDAAIAALAGWLAGLQEDDGGIRQRAATTTNYNPNFASTAAGATMLARGDRDGEAIAATEWVSPFQITAELAGEDTSEGPGGPAAPEIGAFVKNLDALREAVLYGVTPASGSEESTPLAVEALLAAGPYGPYYATLDEESFLFDGQAVGSRGDSRAATLTNGDLRPVEVTGVVLGGDGAGDFALGTDSCSGEVLDPGETCEVSARFAPTVPGFREALARLELSGTAQTVDLALGGMASPLPLEPPVAPATPEVPQSRSQPTTSVPAGAGAISALAATQRVNDAGLVSIATLTCPAEAASCTVVLPKRIRLLIGGRYGAAWVLAPRTLKGGESAVLRIRLGRRAYARLGDGGAVVKLRVLIGTEAGLTARFLRVRIGFP